MQKQTCVVLPLPPPMRSSPRTVSLAPVNAMVMLGVIACLCFSAGEGLRLTPLPALRLEQVGPSGLRTPVSLASGDARHLSGPLDLPAKSQIQKRGKRDTHDSECPPAPGYFGDFRVNPIRPSNANDQVAHTSRLLDTHAPDRAPPFVS